MQLKHLAGLMAAAGLGLGTVALAQNAGPSNGNGAAPVPAAEQPTGRPVWIGIDASPLAPALAHQLRLTPGVGLVVEHVTYDSPAAKAGIKEYDVIQKVDGRLVDDPAHFASLFANHHPGDTVTFTLIREGQAIQAKVTLGERSNAPVEVPPPPTARVVPPPSAVHHSRGLRLPKIKVHIDERGDLVATDGSGHTLFRQPLDFTIDTPELPFSIHIEPKPGKPDPGPADSPDR